VFFSDPDLVDPDGTGPLPAVNGPLGPECDPLLAGRYLCDQLGTTLSSVIGYSLIFDNRNGLRATRGQRVVLSQDFAGLGGDTKYIRTRLDATKYFRLPRSFILSIHGEGGYVHPLKSDPGDGIDAIRLPDRFFGPTLRGFDIRGYGPRVVRRRYETDTVVSNDELLNDAIGGRAYYMGRVELEIPVSANIKNLGFRPSAFIDAGSVWNILKPGLADRPGLCARVDNSTTPINETSQVTLLAGQTCAGLDQSLGPFNYIPNTGFKEFFEGNSAKPRLSIGVGVNWTSPFGPLRIDIAKALLKEEGDETKVFSFNVGTQF
jgi:outer membrane protein insertion porin family